MSLSAKNFEAPLKAPFRRETPNADFAIFCWFFASIFIKFLYEFLNFLKNRITIPFAKFYVKFWLLKWTMFYFKIFKSSYGYRTNVKFIKKFLLELLKHFYALHVELSKHSLLILVISTNFATFVLSFGLLSELTSFSFLILFVHVSQTFVEPVFAVVVDVTELLGNGMHFYLIWSTRRLLFLVLFTNCRLSCFSNKVN